MSTVSNAYGGIHKPSCSHRPFFSDTGLPNAQLIKDKTNVAHIYKNKSVAEQNSVDLAWGLLMEKEFEGLRSLIYKTQDELERFRQLVVNSVMATDIADKELGALRKKRWQKAFHPEECSERYTIDHAPSVVEDSNRKATIVIEHLIQASDVSHTMQHWHVYASLVMVAVEWQFGQVSNLAILVWSNLRLD